MGADAGRSAQVAFSVVATVCGIIARRLFFRQIRSGLHNRPAPDQCRQAFHSILVLVAMVAGAWGLCYTRSAGSQEQGSDS